MKDCLDSPNLGKPHLSSSKVNSNELGDVKRLPETFFTLEPWKTQFGYTMFDVAEEVVENQVEPLDSLLK
jgi:hypothetical protein